MANRLKMAKIHSIQRLRSMHWSGRRIADELEIDRGTVRKYLASGLEGSNPAISSHGWAGSKPATFSGLPGSAESETGCEDGVKAGGGSKPAISPAGSTAAAASPKPLGRPSQTRHRYRCLPRS
jgi:hypothetical protein